MKAVMYVFLFICSFACSFASHEFMHAPKLRRVSLSKIKEQAADAFSEQLCLAAEVIQLAGAVQIAYHADTHKVDLSEEIVQLKEIGGRIYKCRSQYADLFALGCVLATPFDQKDMSVASVFGHLMQTLGAAQQCMITFLQEIFEDKGCTFTKQHMNRLPDVLKTVILYTDDFKALKNLLCSLEKKTRAARLSDVPLPTKEKTTASAQKA